MGETLMGRVESSRRRHHRHQANSVAAAGILLRRKDHVHRYQLLASIVGRDLRHEPQVVEDSERTIRPSVTCPKLARLRPYLPGSRNTGMSRMTMQPTFSPPTPMVRRSRRYTTTTPRANSTT